MSDKAVVDPARDLTFQEEEALFEEHARGQGFTDFTTQCTAYKDHRLQLYWCGYFNGIRARQDWQRGALKQRAIAQTVVDAKLEGMLAYIRGHGISDNPHVALETGGEYTLSLAWQLGYETEKAMALARQKS